MGDEVIVSAEEKGRDDVECLTRDQRCILEEVTRIHERLQGLSEIISQKGYVGTSGSVESNTAKKMTPYAIISYVVHKKQWLWYTLSTLAGVVLGAIVMTEIRFAVEQREAMEEKYYQLQNDIERTLQLDTARTYEDLPARVQEIVRSKIGMQQVLEQRTRDLQDAEDALDDAIRFFGEYKNARTDEEKQKVWDAYWGEGSGEPK